MKKTTTKQKGTIIRLLSYVKPYSGWLVLALLFAVIQIAATLFVPVVIGEAIDFIVTKGDVNFDGVFKKIIELGALATVAAIFQWLVSYCTNKLSYRTIRDIRDRKSVG